MPLTTSQLTSYFCSYYYYEDHRNMLLTLVLPGPVVNCSVVLSCYIRILSTNCRKNLLNKGQTLLIMQLIHGFILRDSLLVTISVRLKAKL